MYNTTSIIHFSISDFWNLKVLKKKKCFIFKCLFITLWFTFTICDIKYYFGLSWISLMLYSTWMQGLRQLHTIFILTMLFYRSAIPSNAVKYKQLCFFAALTCYSCKIQHLMQSYFKFSYRNCLLEFWFRYLNIFVKLSFKICSQIYIEITKNRRILINV